MSRDVGPVILRFIGIFAFTALLSVFSIAADASKPSTVVVLGDSIAAGFGVDPDESFPAVLQRKVDEGGYNYRVINAGVSGDTTAGGLSRINWLLKQNIDILLIELGGNDGLRGVNPDNTRSNLVQIIERVRARNPETRVVLAGMQMPPNMGADYTQKFALVFPEVAQQTKATLIPFILEGVGGKLELNQPDRIHPNPEGHRMVAANAWKFLEPLLTHRK